jgi:hypothetical protein
MGESRKAFAHHIDNNGAFWADARPKPGWIELLAPHPTLVRLLYGVAINTHVRRPLSPSSHDSRCSRLAGPSTCGPLAALEVVLHKTALNSGPVLLTHFWPLAIR